MHSSLALARYRKVAQPQPSEVEDPHSVIEVTLRELLRSAQALLAAEMAGTRGPDDHLNRALTAIYILQSSLDFEQGADIANDLFQLYEFTRLQILRHWRREAGGDLETAVKALEDIYGAWVAIGKTQR
ncbi:flagellar export chaperone FliS [Roseovarius sp.]|jgi:flagellar protein FliS